MIASGMLLNGVDVSTLGLALSEAPGWLDMPKRTRATAPNVRRAGVLALGPSTESLRQITLRGLLDRTMIDALKLALAASTLSVTFADSESRYTAVALDDFQITPESSASMATARLRVSVTLSALDPYAYDVTATTIATINNNPPRFTLGTAPSYPVVTLTGATVVNPILGLYTYAAVLSQSLTLTVTLAPSDMLVIDCARRTIKLNGAHAPQILTAGNFFTLDPVELQRGLGTLLADRPYLARAAAATNVGSFTYQRAWR